MQGRRAFASKLLCVLLYTGRIMFFGSYVCTPEANGLREPYDSLSSSSILLFHIPTCFILVPLPFTLHLTCLPSASIQQPVRLRCISYRHQLEENISLPVYVSLKLESAHNSFHSHLMHVNPPCVTARRRRAAVCRTSKKAPPEWPSRCARSLAPRALHPDSVSRPASPD